jgi:class 3 adenylate cyclase
MTAAGWVVEVREPGRVPLRLVVIDRLPIGRAGEGLLLTGDRISRYHCELRLEADALTVHDTGSSNGTFVNDRRIGDVVRLGAGDRIDVGDTSIVVEPDAASDIVDVGLNATVLGVVPGPLPPGDPDPTSALELSASLAVVASHAADETDDLYASVVGGTITMVFSDIVDSTLLNDRLGDQVWFDWLGRHNDLLRRQVTRYGGTEIKGQGDGFMLTFPSARHAVLFSISVQRDLQRARRDDPEFGVHVRLGVHTGEVIHEAGDIFGRHVNLAARVAAQGAGDEIVVSRLVHELVSSMGDLDFDEPRDAVLKGLPGNHVVYPVRWR